MIYYGNPAATADPSTTAVWDSDYQGIWHMNNNPAVAGPVLEDGTSNGYNGESFGGMTGTDLINGKIGGAINFDGTNDYFAINSINYSTAGALPAITASAWLRTTFNTGSNFTNWSILDFDRSEYFNFFITGPGRFGFSTRASTGGISDTYGGSNGDFNDGQWHYITAVYDGTDKHIYANGVLLVTATNPHSGANLGTGTTRFAFIGEGSEANAFNGGRNNIYYSGDYDEIRYSTIARSTQWIETEYNNQNSPSTFYSVSAQTVVPPLLTASINADATTINPGGNVLYNITVDNTGAGAAFTITKNVALSSFAYFDLDFNADPGIVLDGSNAIECSSGCTGAFNIGTVEYSDDEGTTWAYLPSNMAGGAPNGFDGNITDVRVTMTGSRTNGESFELQYKARVR